MSIRKSVTAYFPHLTEAHGYQLNVNVHVGGEHPGNADGGG